jgi:hypothetical protein
MMHRMTNKSNLDTFVDDQRLYVIGLICQPENLRRFRIAISFQSTGPIHGQDLEKDKSPTQFLRG